jgi:hypothetical protein
MGLPEVIDSGSNYFVIEHDCVRYLQSYQTIVAANDRRGKLWLGKFWDYSVTTAKHVGIFSRMPVKEIRRRIKSGDIKVVELEEVT